MKHTKTTEIIVTVILFAVIGTVFTALTALCPVLPYTLENEADLKPVSFGFPIPFSEQTPDEASMEWLSADTYKYTVVPRYDKYSTHIVAWKAIVSTVINSIAIFLIYTAFSKLPKLCGKILIYLFIGAIITALGMLLPVAPGTFTIDTISPMHFGWPIKFVEQTGDGTLQTYEFASEFLAQSYIAPNYSVYATHINAWTGVLNIILSGAIVAAAINAIRFIILFLRGGTEKVKKYYSEKYLTLLPKDELTKRLRQKQELAEKNKEPKKRFKTLD